MEPFDFDIRLFLALNGDCGGFVDGLMFVISHEYTWIPLYIAVLAWVLYKKGWKTALALLLVCAFAVGMADQTATQMKHFFPKLRPTHYPPLSADGMVHSVYGYLGGMYGTVSSHAANSLAFAVISSCFVRNKWYTVVLSVWVLLVSYSRIYLGVHYPMDICLGYVDGMIYSIIAMLIYNRFVKNKISNERDI